MRDDQADDGRGLHRSLSSWSWWGRADGRADERQGGFAAAARGCCGSAAARIEARQAWMAATTSSGRSVTSTFWCVVSVTHRVRRRVDADDQVGVEVEDLSPRG